MVGTGSPVAMASSMAAIVSRGEPAWAMAESPSRNSSGGGSAGLEGCVS